MTNKNNKIIQNKNFHKKNLDKPEVDQFIEIIKKNLNDIHSGNQKKIIENNNLFLYTLADTSLRYIS